MLEILSTRAIADTHASNDRSYRVYNNRASRTVFLLPRGNPDGKHIGKQHPRVQAHSPGVCRQVPEDTFRLLWFTQ